MNSVNSTTSGFTYCGRRGLLRCGAITAGGLALGGLDLASLLRLRSQASAQASERGTGESSRDPVSVILLWMTGGPSHIDMVDMKPGAPAEVRGPFRPIDTKLRGLQVCELMPGHARVADQLAVVRSLHHEYGVHDDAQHLVQTGYPQLNARQNGQRHPCQGSVTSLFRGTSSGMPPYVCVPEDYRSHMGFYQAAAFLSARHNALNSGGDPSLGNYRPPEFALPAEVTVDRLQDRRELSAVFDSLRRQADADDSLRSVDDVNRQAVELTLGNRARDAFDLSRESDETKERYGRHAWGQYTLQARRLAEAGVSFVTVNLYEKDVDWWDDHYTIEANLRKRLPVFDQAFAALVEDLHERGLSDRVLVVACGEFGRAPRIDANAGRGHWPRAMHAVLSGGRIRTGQIVGATTADGGEPAERPLVPGDLLATIYKALGIDPHATVPDPLGRQIRLIEKGEPIRELVG